MALESIQLIELIREITHPDARQREEGADRVSDWGGSYSPSDGVVISGVLAACASTEKDIGALESQLHALIELGSHGLTEIRILARLQQIDRTNLPDTLAAYISDLLDET